jgi:flagellar hook-length control protein FliK
LASSASSNIQNSAHIHALNGKTVHKASQEKTDRGENFADMLAEAGEAQDDKTAAHRKDIKSDIKTATKTDRADKPAEAAVADAPPAAPEAGKDIKPEAAPTTGKDDASVADKDSDKKDDVAANDNAATDAAADLTQAALPQQPMPKLSLEGGMAPKPEADDSAPVQLAAAQQAAKPPVPANDSAPTDVQDGAEKPGHEFKKSLHEAAAKDVPQAAKPSDAETVKTADAVVQAFKPAAEAPAPVTATHAAPPASATTTIEKPVATAQAAPQEAPRPTPDINQFAVDVSAKSQSGARQFDIRLDPPELGRVDVRLSIDANGNAEAHLTADQPQTLDMLRKDSTSLTQALRDAGLNVSQDGLNFSLKSQSHGDGGQRQAQDNRPGFTRSESRQPEVQATIPHAHVRHALGVLDIKV